MLPRKREKLRSGIERAPRREWPRHRKWLRSHECICTLARLSTSILCAGQIEVSHIRTAANAGTGIKPHDAFAVPMCMQHHRRYHEMGHRSFEASYRLDLGKLAAEFTAKSPDIAMRESLKDNGVS